MPDYFVDLEIETDAQVLADDAVDRLQTRWPQWEPNEGDLEVIQIEALAPMAENAAEVAAIVPHAIFREYGNKLIGRPYSAGSPATTTLTIDFVDTAGYVIPAGSEVDIDGFAFTFDTEIVAASGSAQVTGAAVSAAIDSEEANGLAGDNVSMISGVAGVDAISLEAPTSGGSDPEDDEAYESALSGDLMLQAKTLITTRDFEIWALSKAGIGRAVAEHTGDRAVNVAVATAEGEVVATPIKNELIADYDQYRLVNTVLTFLDPTYTTMSVTYTVKALPGFDFTDLEARIDAMLAALLSPANWGQPKGHTAIAAWVNDATVRANLLIDRIGDVEGVNYVTSLSISGSAGSASGSNWVMSGTYALPRPGTMTGTIT